jgi:uncharacterized membrane protein (DUF485 family)
MSASTPADKPATTDPPATGDGSRPTSDSSIDFHRLAETPEFQALHASRKRYTIVGTLLATAALLIVFGLYGFAPDAMGKAAIGSLTWALVLGLLLVVVAFAMAYAYTRKSREWDAMAEGVLEQHADMQANPTGRFAR